MNIDNIRAFSKSNASEITVYMKILILSTNSMKIKFSNILTELLQFDDYLQIIVLSTIFVKN